MCALLAPAAADAEPRERQALADRYVVVYESAVTDAGGETAQRERRDGFRARKRFERALEGFAATLDPRQVAALERDPEVALVAPDRPVHASDALAAGDTVPTGVRRMGAGTPLTVRGASRAGVAVIDTGVDLDHPDLRATEGIDCTAPGTSADDDNGHGTHVAGTIAARNTGAGVTGVAPGTTIHAVKVLDAAGSGSISSVICGIDWVAGTRADADPANDIAVANLSLGGAGTRVAPCATTTDPMHRAICAATGAGVTFVVAAGNDGRDFDRPSVPDTPAAYPQVLTVTALSDGDGAPGAVGPAPSCAAGEGDDRPASFSNFALTSAGAAHTIAAPGTCITSTWPGGGHDTISGTSMAAPHVAGLVALCLDEGGTAGSCAGRTPAEVIAMVRGNAQARAAQAPAVGFAADPLQSPTGRYYGHLAWGGATATAPAAPTTRIVAPVGYRLGAGRLISGTEGIQRLSENDGARVEVAASYFGADIQPYAVLTATERTTLRRLTIDFDAATTVSSAALSLRIYNFRTGSWQTLDGPRTSVTTDRSASFTTTAPADFVSSTGEIRASARATRSSTGWRLRADQVRFRIEY